MTSETIYLERKDIPREILQHISYKGTKFQLKPSTEVHLFGCAWGGGCRNSYYAVNLDTGMIAHNQVEFGNYFLGAPDSAKVELLTNCMIVEHSYYRGKDMGITLYLHPSRITKMLPKSDDTPVHHKIVLAATAGLKNTYGGRTNIRFTEAHEYTGITQEEWSRAKAELIASKHLNKSGAITVKGRNAVGDVRLHSLGNKY